MPRQRFLIALAITCSCVALFCTIWIIIEPPDALLWVIAVASTEWSLYAGMLGLVGLGLGVKIARSGAIRSGWFALAVGTVAAGLSAIPWFESTPVARSNGVSLSLSGYFHFAPLRESKAIRTSTATFATIGKLDLNLDIYDPPPVKHPGRLPAIIVVHGGSWHQGHRSDFKQWNELLARNGYIVFDIDYRTSPQPNWKSACGDVKAAVGWVRRNATQLGVDPERIALMGRSAGAHLALLAAYTPGESLLPPTGANNDTRVAAVLSLYGPTDLVWGYEHTPTPDVLHSQDVLRRFLGGTPATASFAYSEASPINHVDAATVPTLLIHGGRDLLVCTAHSTRLQAKLASCGVMSKCVIIPYALHGFDYDFYGIGSQITGPVVLRFLHEAMPARANPERGARKL